MGSVKIPEINTFDQFVAHYNISGGMQNYLTNLKQEGYEEADIRVAYAFLSERFGKKEEMYLLLDQVKSGKSWVNAFKQYDSDKETFIPRTFEMGYLDTVLEAGATTDDIMICDRLSYASGKEFSNILDRKLSGETFVAISESMNIINTSETLMRVSVTSDDVEDYRELYGITKEQVFQSFVLADKLNVPVADIIAKVRKGQTEQEILGYYLIKMFK